MILGVHTLPKYGILFYFYLGEISVSKDSSLTDLQLVCYINTPRCTKYTQVLYTVLPLVSVSYVGEISVLGHFIEKSLMTCNPETFGLEPWAGNSTGGIQEMHFVHWFSLTVCS